MSSLSLGCFVEKNKRLVLMDFDGTLTRRDTFPMIIKFILGKWFVVFLPIIGMYVICMKMRMLSAQYAKEHILSCAMKGWKRETVERTGRMFVKKLFENESRSFYPSALEMIRKHKQIGDRVIVVSASPEEWVAPFASFLGVECIATRLEYSNDRFTGKISGINCTGEEKVRRIKALIPDLASYTVEAYGDSPGDLPMLRLADTAFYRPFS